MITDATKGAILIASVLSVGFLAGYGCGYKVYHPKPVVSQDVAHGAQQLPGGGLVVQTSPTTDPLPTPQGLPKTVVVVRRVEVQVKPDCPPPPPDPRAMEDGYTANVPEPKPIKVILSLIRQADSTLRVVATAEGGEVVGGLDIPNLSHPVVVAAPAPRETHWTAMVERIIPVDRLLAPTWGGTVIYNKGPFAGGIGANRYEVRVSAGVRF